MNDALHIASITFVSEPPLKIQSITRNGNNFTITWSGGHPNYQLQPRTELSSGMWTVIVVPTPSLSATVAMDSTTRYFRVVSP